MESRFVIYWWKTGVGKIGIRSKFFWGFDNVHRKIPWIKWNTVTAGKEKGGLGVGSLKALNLALLFRWWWRFRTDHDSLWRKVIVAFHGPDGGMERPQKGGKFPGVWRRILKSCSDFHKVELPVQSWIKNDPPGSTSWVWELERNKGFTVASLRSTFDFFYLRTGLDRETRWIPWVPSKVNIHAWRTMLNRLPTRSNLIRRGIVCLSTLCHFCERVEENEEHLFIGCAVVKSVLDDIGRWWGADFGEASSISALVDIANFAMENTVHKMALISVIFVYLWSVWKLRNGVVFESMSRSSVRLVAGQIQSVAYFWIKSRSKSVFVGNMWLDWCKSPKLSL